jgi:hypothetical protein
MIQQDEKNFENWLNTIALQVAGTDEKFVVNDKVYTKDELRKHFTLQKVTEVDILGYDRHFTIRLYRDSFYSLDEVIEYVSKNIVDTATVKEVRHLNWIKDRNIHIQNPAYSGNNSCSGDCAKAYLKNNVKINEFLQF